MIKNEKIKASEIELTGLNGEDLGIMSTKKLWHLPSSIKWIWYACP